MEVCLEDQWYELEAFILDSDYLHRLQKKYSDCTGAFCGYGVAVKDFQHPTIDFDRNNTYIQSEGINQGSMILRTSCCGSTIRKCRPLRRLCIGIWGDT